MDLEAFGNTPRSRKLRLADPRGFSLDIGKASLQGMLRQDHADLVLEEGVLSFDGKPTANLHVNFTQETDEAYTIASDFILPVHGSDVHADIDWKYETGGIAFDGVLTGKVFHTADLAASTPLGGLAGFAYDILNGAEEGGLPPFRFSDFNLKMAFDAFFEKDADAGPWTRDIVFQDALVTVKPDKTHALSFDVDLNAPNERGRAAP